MRCGGSEHKSRLDRVRQAALGFLESVLTLPGYTLWERWPVSFGQPWALCRCWLTFVGMGHAIVPFAALRGNLHGVRFWRVGEESLRGPYTLLARNDSTTKTLKRQRPGAWFWEQCLYLYNYRYRPAH